IFELLPERFTIPQILLLFESIFETQFDKRNFSRKLMATGLVTKTRDKDKTTSKKGAYLYKLNKKNYQANLTKLLSIIPKGTAYLATH
ncbi:MAG TPA: DNA mismatch repair protein MutT, partial [Phnomibacter sp.]|nr:DNA mismatch repair protein MutT [Phnomibacter sp.]